MSEPKHPPLPEAKVDWHDIKDRREWIRKLIESLDAKERRDKFSARVRRERANREQRNSAA